MKKRLFALMLVLAMVLGMNTVAFAEGTHDASSTFKKAYSSEKQVYPTENLTFTAKQLTGVTENAPKISFDDEITVSGAETSINYYVDITENTALGIYTYEIKEATPENPSAGVVYNTDSAINISVVVENAASGTGKVVRTGVTKVNEDKEDTITNTYNVGEFTVDKNITGNLSKQSDVFTINVKLTADKIVNAPIKVAGEDVAASEWKDNVYTTNLKLSGNTEVVKFENIPYGVTVEVTEPTHEVDGYTYKSGEATFTIGTEEGQVLKKDVVIVNDKSDDIRTGIIVNNMPYIVALVVLAAAAVVFFRRRREF